MLDGDVAFVTDSWLRAAWHREKSKLVKAWRKAGVGSRARERRTRDAASSWYGELRPHVATLVETLDILVACDRDDENHIAGWLAAKAGEPVQVYVKFAYRPYGVDALLRDAMEGL